MQSYELAEKEQHLKHLRIRVWGLGCATGEGEFQDLSASWHRITCLWRGCIQDSREGGE